MADIERSAQAIWHGDLLHGNGTVGTASKVVVDIPMRFNTRFEHESGTNPEEFIAAAHASCYSMAFSAYLARQGHAPERLETTAHITLAKQRDGFSITKSRIEVRGWVDGLTEEQFQQMAREADKGCPVSNLLRNGLEIEIHASLGK